MIYMHFVRLTDRKISDLKKDKKDQPEEKEFIVDFDSIVKIEEAFDKNGVCITTASGTIYIHAITTFDDSASIDWLMRMYKGYLIQVTTKPIFSNDVPREVIIQKTCIEAVVPSANNSYCILLNNKDRVYVDTSIDAIKERL